MGIGLLSLMPLRSERSAAFTAAGFTVRERTRQMSRMDALREAGDTVRAVLTNGRGGLSGAEMALLPKLEIVCTIGAGYECIDLNIARSRGIAVTHCPGTNAPIAADSAMMLLLATARRLIQSDRFVRAGGWQETWPVESPTICGKRLGILGMGMIGSGIAQRAARGFDMEVGYHNRAAVAASPYRYFGSLIELAQWADFLIAAAPGGAGTRHLVNADVLSALGPDGCIVNIGRGTVVDTEALIDALETQRIAGAGLDVVEGEPNIPAKLLQMDNVVWTPHCAGKAPEAYAAATALTLANLNAHFSGKPLVTPASFNT